MKEKVSSLEGVLIKRGRRVGNTTRICDNAIQLLFSGKIVAVIDHYYGGSKHSSQNAKRYLLSMIIGRLEHQHNLYLDEHFKKGFTVAIDPFDGSIFIKLDIVDENGNYIGK